MASDPILEEIWRVRELLSKEHGGLHGLFAHARKLERAHLRRTRRAKSKKPPKVTAGRGRKG